MELVLTPTLEQYYVIENTLLNAYNEVIEKTNQAKRNMDYGAYMDNCDGIGYDDYDSTYYGFTDWSMLGYLEGIGDILGKVWNVVKGVGSKAFGVVKTISKTAYDFGKKGVTGTWNFFTKTVPTFTTKAYNWVKGAPITAPVRWTVSGAKWVGKQLYTGAKWLVTPQTKPVVQQQVNPGGQVIQPSPEPVIVQPPAPQGQQIVYQYPQQPYTQEQYIAPPGVYYDPWATYQPPIVTDAGTQIPPGYYDPTMPPGLPSIQPEYEMPTEPGFISVPNWLPYAIGGGALLLVLVLSGGSKKYLRRKFVYA